MGENMVSSWVWMHNEKAKLIKMKEIWKCSAFLSEEHVISIWVEDFLGTNQGFPEHIQEKCLSEGGAQPGSGPGGIYLFLHDSHLGRVLG